MYVFKLYLLNPFLWSVINCKICTALCIEMEKKLCNFQLQASWWAYFKKQFVIETPNLLLVLQCPIKLRNQSIYCKDVSFLSVVLHGLQNRAVDTKRKVLLFIM